MYVCIYTLYRHVYTIIYMRHTQLQVSMRFWKGYLRIGMLVLKFTMGHSNLCVGCHIGQTRGTKDKVRRVVVSTLHTLR
jgi:hypothetical protein